MFAYFYKLERVAFKVGSLSCACLLATVYALLPQKATAETRSLTQHNSALLSNSPANEVLLTPYLDDIRNHLPADLTMRLPSSIQSSLITPENNNSYSIQYYSAAAPITISVNFSDCGNRARQICSAANFSAYYATSDSAQLALQDHRAVAVPITLAPNIQGYLVEGDGSTQYYSSVMWEQDTVIYKIRFPVQDRQNLLYAAKSMVNAAPIVPATSTQELAIGGPSQPIIIETTIVPENSDSTMNQVVQTPNIDDNGRSFEEPPPLPDGLDIKDSEDVLSLGLIRAVPVVEFQGRSSVFSNQGDIGSGSSDTGTGSTDNTLIVNSAAVRIAPEIGDRTRLVGGVRLAHAIPLSDDNESYSAIDTDLGVRHQLDQNMSVEGGWEYRQLFNAASSSDLKQAIPVNLSEHAINLELNRVDFLNERLLLSSNLGVQTRLAGRSSRSRWSGRASAYFGYILNPDLLVQLGSSLKYTDFFEGASFVNQQIGAQITYNIDEGLSLGGSVSYLFGESVNLIDPDEAESLDNFTFGLHLNIREAIVK